MNSPEFISSADPSSHEDGWNASCSCGIVLGSIPLPRRTLLPLHLFCWAVFFKSETVTILILSTYLLLSKASSMIFKQKLFRISKAGSGSGSVSSPEPDPSLLPSKISASTLLLPEYGRRLQPKSSSSLSKSLGVCRLQVSFHGVCRPEVSFRAYICHLSS